MIPLITPAAMQTIFMFALLAAAFYFMILRPGQKRMKTQMEMMNALQPGTRVVLAGGMFATITQMGEQQVVVEISPGVEVTLSKQAIARVAKDNEDEFEFEDLDGTEPADELLGEPAQNAEPELPSTDQRPQA